MAAIFKTKFKLQNRNEIEEQTEIHPTDKYSATFFRRLL